MSPVLYVVMFVVAGVAIVAVAIWWLRRMANNNEQAMRARFPSAHIVRSANFFGQESLGKTQLRGNGTMAITADGITFERWLPRKQFHIPAASIQRVETPRWFLGKSYGRPLLQVVYTGENGQTDSITWYVPDLATVKTKVENLLG